MVDIAQAIQALDINAQFVINGTPTNEAEYQAQVKYVSGADELPIPIVNALPVTLTVTLGLKNDVAIGVADIEL